MSRCRASGVSSRVLAARAIDLLVYATRISIAPAATASGLIIGLPHATDHEPARTTAAATIAEERQVSRALAP